MKKIVVACDSMKGSLTSAEVVKAASLGIHDACSGIEVVGVPVADGGEGTAAILTGIYGGRWMETVVDDPLRRKVAAGYGVATLDGVKTAVIDLASSSGLTLLTPGERNPMVTSSYGFGELMVKAWEAGCRRYILGLGGSATNDAGKGMLEALGVRFLDAEGQPLPDGGASLSRLATIDTRSARHDILGSHIEILCDVANPLCGEDGASAVYGPQKGASPAMVAELDEALLRFSVIVAESIGVDIADMAGAGAAGGAGAAMLAFTDAVMVRGIDSILEKIKFHEIIGDADIVITGEGRIDRQTLSGKVPYGVLKACIKQGIPTIAIAGSVADGDIIAGAGFAAVYAISEEELPLEEKMKPETAAANIRCTCRRIVLSAASGVEYASNR